MRFKYPGGALQTAGLKAPNRQQRPGFQIAQIHEALKGGTMKNQNIQLPALNDAPFAPAQIARQSLGLVSLLVRNYDEAIAFFVGKLGFYLVEDTPVPTQNKRWVVIAPPGAIESRILLAKASSPEQASHIGNQTGGRVFLFLYTDNFWRDYQRYREHGILFVREPKEEPYGTVAVFKDLYGNLWDLLEPKPNAVNTNKNL